MISRRTPFIREINALKIDVKGFDKSCILKYWNLSACLTVLINIYSYNRVKGVDKIQNLLCLLI